MEKSHRDILIRLRKNLIDDLDIDNDIVQPLRNEYILKEDDIRRIYVGATKEERASNLLDILPQCGPSAFDVFHQSLKHHYEWLSDEIDILLGNYQIETNGEIDYYAGPPYIPPLSPLTVTREKKIDQLKIALHELISAEYITLHGMKGFGKSCLVASTLKDVKLVKNLFSNQVYWIKFTCDRSIDEEILIQLNTLYRNVRNVEIQPESFTPLEKDSLIHYLGYYFNKRDNCNALLILDDVYDEKIIDTFDFKCKTIVLTADLDVIRQKGPKIIEMNDGFTEAETLGLFAKALETEVNKLPIEAKRIHEECKGMPLLIAMFAAQFEEFKCDMRIRPDRWRYYLKSLQEKDRTNKVMREFLRKQETIFDICIEQLKPDLRKRYESLAIFCEDLNITPKTLEIFWEQDIFQVEELMLDLCHKSLAAKKWNKDLNTYIYGVHDLLLCHLRKKLTYDELKHIHKSIITQYRKYCDNDFSELPDDNYIYSYIGYHLEQAKLFEEFPHLYLNFDFIQAKLKYSGLNDLLLDLRKYRQYITLDYKPEYVEKICDLERFLQEQASIIVEHKHKKCLDIIQIAMNHPYRGYIAKTANDLAKKRQKYLYLSHKKNLEYANVTSTEEVSTGTCISSFTDDSELILTGNTSGKIILWNFRNRQQKIFNGHREGSSIRKVIVSTTSDCFLSLCDAGIIKLFPLFDEYGEIYDRRYMHVESPRQKQTFWSGLYGSFNCQDDSLVEFRVQNEIILDMAFGYEDNYIAACTDKGTVQIWNRFGERMFTLTGKFGYIPKIAFAANAFSLYIMDESKGAFSMYSNPRNDHITYQYLACYNLQLKSEKVIFFHHIPKRDDSLMVVTAKQAIYVRWWWGEGCAHNFKKQERGFVDDSTVTYVCATITYDGKYIILADSAGFINVWNTYSGYQPIATYKSRVISLDSYWLKDEDCHIICGNGNNALYKWQLPVQESNNLPRKCLFDAVVSFDEMDVVIRENPSKKIIVSRGESIIKEFGIEGKTIANLQLSADGNKAVYVMNVNEIHLLDTLTGTTEVILTLLDRPIQFVKIIDLCNCNVLLCKWKGNNLKVWLTGMLTGISKLIFGIDIQTVDSMHDVYVIKDNYIIAITHNGIIMIWYIETPHRPWQLISQTDLPDPFSYIIFSCLSYNQNYLAILDEYRLILLHITHENLAASATHIQISQSYFTQNFVQKAICCDISKNEQYIAVGFESGQISIIDIRKQMEIDQLSYHSNPITQLYWAPATVDVPILFSLTSDELIWWNVDLAKNNIRSTLKSTRSRMGISRSLSTPSFSPNAFLNRQIPNSRSVDVGVSNLQNNETSTATFTDPVMTAYWKNKVGRNPEMPELLAVIELPPSRDSKVCISSNFTKFVIVDMYGSVSTFKLIDYNESISET